MVNQWGGKRTGSGRPARWKSGDTVAVRIPEKFRDEVIAFARLLDEGQSVSELLSCSLPESLENVQKYQEVRKVISDYTRRAKRTSNPKWDHAKRLLDELSDVIRGE
jgi:hypothetical protein